MSNTESVESSVSSFISYPSSSSTSQPVASTSSAPAAPPPLLKDRLYIGNLHPTVDEYTLLQVFSKHGQVAKLDFLFHKTGPAKGKPRGYAFIEYSSAEDALKAQSALHDKLLRGRKLVVTFAHQAPQVDPSRPSRRPGTDTSRPTTLSLLKTQNKPAATKDKIAAMEAKLRQMEQKPHDSSTVTVLPSSLPAKPLMPSMPTISSDAAQRKPGILSSSLTSTLRTGGSTSSTGLLNPNPLISKPNSAPSTPTASSTPFIKPAKVAPSKGGHRHKMSSLGIVLKR